MSLDRPEPWRYYGSSSSAALTALRARMGASYATSPADADLLLALTRSVQMVERATGRFFRRRDGDVVVPGESSMQLDLPWPVVSADQGGDGVTSIVVDDTEVDLADVVVSDGAAVGPGDPRDAPRIEFARATGVGAVFGAIRRWPEGPGRIVVTASWGYLEEDGSSPEPILNAIARLVIQQCVPLDDLDGREDYRRGGLLMEQTQGRMYQVGMHAGGAGLTLDREIDQVLRSYRRPPGALVLRTPRPSRSAWR